MGSDWFEAVKSSIPRGFSRCFIIQLLKEKPHTGKEIMDRAADKSGGAWRPSPGLIYPLLGRLLDEGLIEEEEGNSRGGKYKITEKGIRTAEDIQKIEDAARKQLDVLFRIGSVGRFAAADLLERIICIGSMLGANTSNMTKGEMARYNKFPKDELYRIEKRQRQGDDMDEIKVE